MSKRMGILVLLGIVITSCTQGQSLFTQFRDLNQRLKSGQITQEEFDKERHNLFSKTKDVYIQQKDSANAIESRKIPSKPTLDQFNVEILILAAKYWKANEMVRLSDNMKIAINGKLLNGNTFDEDSESNSYITNKDRSGVAPILSNC